MNLPLLHQIHRGFDLRDNLNDLEKKKDLFINKELGINNQIALFNFFITQ